MPNTAPRKHARIKRSKIHKDGTRRLNLEPQRPMNEGDSPTWDEMRFSAETIATFFEAASGGRVVIPHHLCETLSDKINWIMDRDHNQRTGLADGLNVSLSEVQWELYTRARNIGAELYQAIENLSEYGGVEPGAPLALIHDILEGMGCVVPHEVKSVRGRPRVGWRSNATLWARWVTETMKNAGRPDQLPATNANSVTAAVCVKIVMRAYGEDVDFTANDFVEGLLKAGRDRRKNTELDDIRAVADRIRCID